VIDNDTRTVADVVGATWCGLLELPAASDSDDFFGLGGSSLLAVRLVEAVEAELGIKFPIEVLFLDGTFGAVVAACESACATAGTGTSR
jgi:acyl carrier protein